MSSKREAFLRRIPGLRELQAIRKSLDRIENAITAQTALLRQQFVSWQLATNPRYQDARRLNRYEHQVYSQGGEDGVIAELFRRIGVRSRTFIEIGVGDGMENNTTHLLLQGWQGCWLEANPEATARIGETFREHLDSRKLKLQETFVTAENVAVVLTKLGADKEPDLLSIDVDRNTWFIWEALADTKARVVVVEYNSLYPPDQSWVIDYQPDKGWNGTARFGASLKAYEELGRKLGYALVGCELLGTNAFFVRSDLVGDHFAAPFTAENHYEPPRLWLLRREGHPRCVND